MSMIQRKEKDTCIKRTNTVSSTNIPSRNNCLYKKDFLKSLQKLPLSISKDGIIKTYISNKSFPLSEKKDNPISITPLKSNINTSLATTSYKKNNIILTNEKTNLSNIENLTLNIEELFLKIKNLFSNCENCIKECEEFIELFNNNFDFILEKITPLEYMPLICNSMNIILISVVVIYCLSYNEKYYIFKFDTNRIFNDCKIIIDIIFEKCRNKSENNFKEKSNSMINLYKNVYNSLNIIISKLNEIIPSISSNFELLIKNIRAKNNKEIYNFYIENIHNLNKNNIPIKEFKLTTNDNNLRDEKNKEIRRFSVDVNKKKPKLEHLENINSINTYSINGMIFPYKKMKNINKRNYNYINGNYTNENSFNNKNIYHTIEGNNVKIIINEDKENYNENKENKFNQLNTEHNNNSILYSIQNSKIKNFYSYTPSYKENSFKKKSYTKNPFTLKIPLIPFLPKKSLTLLINIDNTLTYKLKNSNTILKRKYLNEFLLSLIPYYELISFTYNDKSHSEKIINLIDEKERIFDFNLYKENSTYLNEEYYKDFNKLGRNIKRTIIVEDINNSFGKHNDNTILIKSFIKNEEDEDEDEVLKNLSKILIIIAKNENDDVRKSLKMIQGDIKEKLY